VTAAPSHRQPPKERRAFLQVRLGPKPLDPLEPENIRVGAYPHESGGQLIFRQLIFPEREAVRIATCINQATRDNRPMETWCVWLVPDLDDSSPTI
jgi:hypothetical protein